MNKVIRYNTDHIISSDGEIVEKREQRTYKVSEEPPYVKLYINDIGALYGLNPMQVKLLWALARRLSYTDKWGYVCTLATGLKREIMEEVSASSLQVVSNGLSSLCKGGYIERLATGVYRMNPYLFGRGKWSDIEKIRLEIDYGEWGRKLTAYVNYAESEKERKRNQKVDLMELLKNSEPEVRTVEQDEEEQKNKVNMEVIEVNGHE